MTGLYNAPATVAAQQSIGGYQLLPNNDIFNTRIDSLPINSNSASWITASGSTPVTYQQISKPLNYTNSSTDSRASCFSILRPITVRIRFEHIQARFQRKRELRADGFQQGVTMPQTTIC